MNAVFVTLVKIEAMVSDIHAEVWATMARKRRITAEQRAQWDEERRAARVEERRRIGVDLERREQSRRERLRRLSFGLLGREPLTRQ